MKRSLLALLLIAAASVVLSGCGLWTKDTDETQGWSAQKLYGEAKDAMNNRTWDRAIKYLEKLESLQLCDHCNHPVFRLPSGSTSVNINGGTSSFTRILETAVPARLIQFGVSYTHLCDDQPRCQRYLTRVAGRFQNRPATFLPRRFWRDRQTTLAIIHMR